MTGRRTFLGFAAALLMAVVCGCSGSPAAPERPAAPLSTGVINDSSAGLGNSPYRLGQAGWRCLNVPNHGVHCEDPHWHQNGPHVQVKVFDTTDPLSQDAEFLGTESLIRADHYQGQPCLPGHGEYFLLMFGPRAGYYLCHHFDF